LLWIELSQDAAEPQCILAKRRPHPVLAGRRGITLVEYQIDDLEHRRQTRAELGTAWHLERNARLRERSFRPHDALRDRRLRRQECAGYLRRRKATEQAQRECEA